jgi:hypothetical protein
MAKALELIMIAAHAILVIYCLSHLDWVVVENAMVVASRSRDGLVIAASPVQAIQMRDQQ